MTAIWMVPVTMIPQHYKSFSRDREASLSRDQARVESPLCHLSVCDKCIVLNSVLDLTDCTLCQIHQSCAKPLSSSDISQSYSATEFLIQLHQNHFLENLFGALLTPITFNNVKFYLVQKIFCTEKLIKLKILQDDMNDI